MIEWDGGRLSARQRELVAGWLPDARLIADLSWGLVDTVVLHVGSTSGSFSGSGSFIVKAAGDRDHHVGREITAHESFTGPLIAQAAAARMRASDRAARVLVTDYLEGSLVEGSPAEFDVDSYEKAGRLLRSFHDQSSTVDEGFEQRATQRSLAWLDSPHAIAPDAADAARALLLEYRTGAVTVVPTHGDWQPRNWLVDGAAIKVIDFGRFDLRPAETDFCRLAAQHWLRDAQLEAAFFAGYGGDPRQEEQWRVLMLREAIGTAAWAYQVGDAAFEQQGHRMLASALERFVS